MCETLMRKPAKFGFWLKLGGLLTFWFVAEALTLKALVTLVVWFGQWGLPAISPFHYHGTDKRQ